MKKISILFLSLLLSSYVFSQPYQIQWQSCIGGSNIDRVYDMIAVDKGYLLAGSTESSDGDISFFQGGADYWLVHINLTGEIIWEKTYGGTNGEYCVRIFPDNKNNYYLLGSSYSSDGDISNDPYPESEDFWIVKVDSVGSIIWERIVGGNNHDQFWTGTSTFDGGVLAYGWAGSTDGDVSVNYGAYDTWMIKLNGDGDIEWDFSLGTKWFDYGQAVTQTSDGGFLCGSSSAMTEGGGNITCKPHSYDMPDAIVIKLDKDRNIEWQRCLGGSQYDGTTALEEVDDGYLVGAYTTSNDGDVSGWHGDHDIWIVKLDFDGNIIWQNCFGGSKNEWIDHFLPSANGDFHVVGFTSSNDGDVSGNHTIQENKNDIWLIHVSSEGELLSQQCIGGIGNEESWRGVVKKSDYNFVIAGRTNHGPSFDVQCTPHGGSLDIDFWVFEISDTTVNINEQLVPEAKIKTYPNPAKNYVCFEAVAGQQIQSSQLTICNGQGAILKKPILYASAGKLIWDTRTIQPGIYFYTLTLNSFTKSGKLIIK